MKREEAQSGPWLLRLLGTGAGLGISLACIEMILFARSSGYGFSLAELAWAGLLSALVCALGFVLMALPMAILWKVVKGHFERLPLAALAVFMASLFLCLFMDARHGLLPAITRAPRSLLLMTGVLGAACALLTHLLGASSNRQLAKLKSCAHMLPGLLLGFGVALILIKRGSTSMGALAALAGLTLCALALLRTRGELPHYKGWVHCLMLALLAPAAWFLQPDAPGSSTPHKDWHGGSVKHVILISIDTLRASSLSCYEPSASTPAIDQIAEDGIRFERAISPAPWTLPALTSIMTGLAPSVHGALTRNGLVPSSQPTLAQLLAAKGFTTGAIGSNHLLTRGFSRGFHSSDFYPHRPHWESLGLRLLDRTPEDTTESLTDLSMQWLEQARDKPFFLWLHYFDPHSPYAPPEEFMPKGKAPARIGSSVGPALFTALRESITATPEEQRWVKALYDGEVRYVDSQIARLIAKLKELNLYDDSLILLTSDHGEEFWEHESLGHGHNLFDESLRVPLLIKLPAALHKGQVAATVSTQRILPTVLELCGIPRDALPHLPASLTSTWTGTDGAASAASSSQGVLSSGMLYGEDKFSLTREHSKYIRGMESQREWFFDLEADAGELYPLSPLLFSETDSLRKALLQYQASARSLRKQLGARKEQVDNVDTEALKALGYI